MSLELNMSLQQDDAIDIGLQSDEQVDLGLNNIYRVGGTSNYEDLRNLPKINNVELKGNKSLSDLGITIPTKTSDLINDSGFITANDIPNSKFHHLFGEVLTSSNNSLKGIGSVDIALINGIAVIEFDIKITSAGSGGDVFSYGITKSVIQSLDNTLPNIIPIAGGHWTCTAGGATTDYGSYFEINSTNYWLPARYYTTDGAIGGWSCAAFNAAGARLTGTCYGSY